MLFKLVHKRRKNIIDIKDSYNIKKQMWIGEKKMLQILINVQLNYH